MLLNNPFNPTPVKDSTRKKVSVIVPCRNERGYIERFIDALLRQETPDFDCEFLIADGRSDDGTVEVLRRYQEIFPSLRIIDNPQRFVSTGLNAAVLASTGDYIVRMDVHTEYADDYICQCLRVLEGSGADNVGGPWQAAGRTYWQKAIALAFQSPFSSGGAGSHQVAYEGPVDSVYLGCWRKSTLLNVGCFDEELIRNQDDELNLRIAKTGGKIWQSPSIRSRYYPRDSLLDLLRQYAQYGYWKVRVIQKHRLPASFRHLVPGAFVGSLLVLAALTPFIPISRWALAALLLVYAAGNLIATVHACRKPAALKFLPAMPWIFMAYHFGYGYGFLRGAIDFFLLKSPKASFTELTRPKKT